MIAKIIINSTVKNLNKVFDYNIPDEMLDDIKIGSRVVIPFGKGSKIEEGFVIDIKEKSSYETKDIISIQKDFSLDENKIELAKLMARKYFCNVSDAI